MTSSIKILAVILFLSSCSSLNFTYPYFDFWQNALFRNNIDVSEAYIDDQKYSFIHVSYKDNDAIFVLSGIDGDVYTWVGANLEKIKTYKGLIIETYNIQPDIKIDTKDLSKIINSDFQENTYFFNLSIDNPSIFALPIKYKLIKKSNNDDGKHSITYKKDSDIIRWKNKDKIVFDSRSGLPIHSSISITPLEPNIELHFYYKY